MEARHNPTAKWRHFNPNWIFSAKCKSQKVRQSFCCCCQLIANIHQRRRRRDNEVGLTHNEYINPPWVRHNQTNEGDCAISRLITVTFAAAPNGGGWWAAHPRRRSSNSRPWHGREHFHSRCFCYGRSALLLFSLTSGWEREDNNFLKS